MKTEDINEVWVLRWDSGETLPPMDGDSSDCFMAFGSEDDAIEEAKEAVLQYGDADSTLTAVRIHPSRLEGETVNQEYAK